MRKITEAEAAAIVAKPVGNASPLRTMLLDMKPGEILLVESKDWTWKTKTPSAMCRRLEWHSTLKFECKVALDGSGWIIKREK
jgi:hypothetical protein